MKSFLFKTITILKSLVFLIRPHLFLGFLKHPFLFFSNLAHLTKWISKQNHKTTFNDYFSFKRNYDKREKLYQYVLETNDLKNEPIDYVEFGVCGGYSFKWWTESCLHPESRFYGLDTFEGLPEKWGIMFKAGDMNAEIPETDDVRAQFLKGLFQDTLPEFLRDGNLRNEKRKVVMLDADLFSSTLFALTSMAPYLKPGDIIFFDEFNVPNHEFFAYKLFTETYYVRLKLVGAVNNYYQVAFLVE